MPDRDNPKFLGLIERVITAGIVDEYDFIHRLTQNTGVCISQSPSCVVRGQDHRDLALAEAGEFDH